MHKFIGKAQVNPITSASFLSIYELDAMNRPCKIGNMLLTHFENPNKCYLKNRQTLH